MNTTNHIEGFWATLKREATFEPIAAQWNKWGKRVILVLYWGWGVFFDWD
jgi:hypothetical protein